MEVSEEIVYNTIIDWRKKDIDPMQRAKLMIAYMKKMGLSQRGMAEHIGVPKSTVCDWLLWLKIDETQKNQLLKEGVSQTDIYRELRKRPEGYSQHIEEVDIMLDKMINRLRKKYVISKVTYDRAIRLRDELNKLISEAREVPRI